LTAALLSLAIGLLLLEKRVVPLIGYSLICSEAPQPADLILVLGGDFYGPRVLKGAELGKLGYAPLVMISGPLYQGRPEGEWAIDYLQKLGYPRSLFCVFARSGTSTIDEALGVAQELQRRKVKRVLFVTSSYHSRRADIVLRLLSGDVTFTSVPAPDSQYNPDRWWEDESSRKLFFSEWSKIVGSLIAYPRYRFSPRVQP
jgi:uncharacterized SAM-binding protein YcdF (DUF218 family)